MISSGHTLSASFARNVLAVVVAVVVVVVTNVAPRGI